MTDRDLLGDPIKPPSKAKRKPTPARGYSSSPGTGPAGETCGSCTHVVRFRRFHKCGLVKRTWTKGAGSDVKARTPACRNWEKPA